MTNNVFIGKVDRISGSGNAIIDFRNHHINIGPVSRRAVGEQVRGVLPNQNSNIGYCVSNRHTTPEYWEWVIKNFDVDVTLFVRVKRKLRNGNVLVCDSRSKEFIITSTEKDIEYSDTLKVRIQDSKLEHSNARRADLIDVVEKGQINGKMADDWVEKVKNELDITEIKDSDVDIRINSDGSYRGSISSNDTLEQSSTEEPESTDTLEQSSTEEPESTNTLEQSSTKDLDPLRKQAEKDSVENVTESTVSRTQTTRQYRRSQAVRDYVMARADGVCEGCEADAPFTSKTGDPYLHAHHIHELSDGGSDTPDTVIALCPNCHYFVHHGKGGNEYNKKLEEKLSEIEDGSQHQKDMFFF